MNSSFLYHAWGLYNHKCTREEYKGNTIILHIEAKEREKVCPQCGHRHLVKNGFRFRDFIDLQIGGKKVIIRMKVQRFKCKNKDCGYDRQEKGTSIKLTLCLGKANLSGLNCLCTRLAVYYTTDAAHITDDFDFAVKVSQ